MDKHVEAPGPWWKRVAWMAVFWLMGVAALGVVAALIKLVMRAVGLSH